MWKNKNKNKLWEMYDCQLRGRLMHLYVDVSFSKKKKTIATQCLKERKQKTKKRKEKKERKEKNT